MIATQTKVIKAICDSCGYPIKPKRMPVRGKKILQHHYAVLQRSFGYGHHYDTGPDASDKILCDICYMRCANALSRDPATWEKVKRPNTRYVDIKTPFDSLYKGNEKVDRFVIKNILKQDYSIPPFMPSTRLDDAMLLLERFLTPIKDRDVKERFTLDGLGYRCCDKDEDGVHGRWRCWVATGWEINGGNPSIFVTADTPAMAVCKMAIQIWTWLRRNKACPRPVSRRGGNSMTGKTPSNG